MPFNLLRAVRAVERGAAVAIVIVGVGLAGCAGSTPPPVTAADASRASSHWPGTTVADLERGRSLYVGHCSSCHVPPDPRSQPAEAWPAQVAEMQERAELSDDEAALVERYLITVASRAPAP